jgi:hypothetical protein
VVQQPNWGLGRLLVVVSKSHTIRQTHTHTHTIGHTHTHTHTVGLLWTGDQLVAEANALNENNIYALCGIRTRDPSKQGTPGLGLRQHGHRNQL